MGALLDALLSVAKVAVDTAVTISEDMSSHDRKAAAFRLFKDQLADAADVLTPSEITGTQWQNVTGRFASGAKLDSVIGLVDTTVFGSAKNGYLFTDDKIYYQEIMDQPKKIWYDDIESVRVIGRNKAKDSERSLVFQMKDGREIVWNAVSLNKTPLSQMIEMVIAIDNPVET